MASQPDAGAVAGGQPGDRLAAPGGELRNITRDDLLQALTGFYLAVRDYRGQQGSGQIEHPGKVADALHATLSRIAAEKSPDASPDDRSALADADNAIGQVIRLAESWRMAGGQLDASRVTGALLAICDQWTGMPLRELEAIGTGPLLDPDCRDGKCGSCVGAPCEHSCHKKAVTGRG